MKSLLIASLLCVLFSLDLQANSMKLNTIYYFDPASGIEFIDEDTCMFFNYGSSLGMNFNNAPFRYTYKIEQNDGVSFIEFIDGNDKQRYLILANKDLFILYSETKKQPYKIGFRNFGVMESFDLLSDAKIIKTSSELREESISYKADNLRILDAESPWVDGSKSSGVGETIRIQNWTSQRMVLFLGYVSYRKPFLYSMNSRPKKISILFENTNTLYNYDLEDTPNPQTIDMHNAQGDILITILEVYPGEKYSDLCIHAIASQ